MGKAEKGTPKDIANRIKAKGLQKLRWYCQMCQKQCRDENGFKCHTTSESHQRQLLLFADDPDKYLDSFSEDFLEGFLSLLKRRFNTKRVRANNVYQEYIQDREHVHMNATKWETLTDFVKWMGREGHCVVDETEKGWYIAWIDREPETLLRDQLKRKKEKNEKDDEDRFQDFINKQIEMGKTKDCQEEQYSELQREEEETIKLNMKLSLTPKDEAVKISSNPLALKSGTSKISSKKEPLQKKKSALEEIIEEEKRRKKSIEIKEATNSTKKKHTEDSWLARNIVVKIVTKELGSRYYKAKGVVIDVIDKYLALVQILDNNHKLKLDQTHLETVVPSIGRKVLILSGKFKGMTAVLQSLEIEKFSATLLLSSEPYKDFVSDFPYEHFSKLHMS